jgi:hypothetical protein
VVVCGAQQEDGELHETAMIARGEYSSDVMNNQIRYAHAVTD